jgi:hypothetical protein
VSFECRIDARPYRRCGSPFTARRLGSGHHTFKVRAVDGSGQINPSPAAYSFTILPRR